MRAALDLPNFPPLGTPERVRELAEAAAPVWEALFVWDHLLPLDGATRVHDWWELARVAAESNPRLLVGPMIVALGRREVPQVVERVRELEALAPGRVVVGFGAGVRRDLRAAGVSLPDSEVRPLVVARARELAAALSEAGSTVPLWTSGAWPPKPGGLLGAEVAAGAVPIALGGPRSYGPPPPGEVAAVRAQVDGGVVAFTGVTGPAGSAPLAAYAEAGLDWWLEDLWRVEPARALELARSGPGPFVAATPW